MARETARPAGTGSPTDPWERLEEVVRLFLKLGTLAFGGPAAHIGLVRAGWRGLAAGTCFILPAMSIVLLLAWAYVCYGSLPQVAWIVWNNKPLYEISPVRPFFAFRCQA